MTTATPLPAFISSLSPNITQYQELVHHVTVAAAALQNDSAALDTLTALPTLTEAEQAQLAAIHARMNSIEEQLVGKLNPQAAY